MSKAFTREENEGPDLPDLPALGSVLPPGAKNYMTRAGADAKHRELARMVQTERPELVAQSRDDPEAKRRLSALDQRIFQLEQGLESAEVVSPGAGPPDTVAFGASVTVREENGNKTTYRIVGVGETDLDRNWVSWLSPMARALMQAKVGERVRFKVPAGEQELEIVAITYD